VADRTYGLVLRSNCHRVDGRGLGATVDRLPRASVSSHERDRTTLEGAASVASFPRCRDPNPPRKLGPLELRTRPPEVGLRRPRLSQRLRIVSAVPHWGWAQVPVLRVPALQVSAAMRRRQDWREEQVVAPTGLRPLSWARWFGCS
jgi:hypothetical protein